MQLFIHTAGRATLREQKTLGSFIGSPDLLSRTTLVVQKSELGAYAQIAKLSGVGIIALPSKIKTLSPTRQWILDRAYVDHPSETVCMLDDDLLFFERRKDDETKFLKIQGEEVGRMFRALEERMRQGFAHGGILAREGANRITGQKNVYDTRMMRVLAYNPRIVKEVGARFDRLPTKQDFDMTLQLLRAGFSNLLLADYVQGQYGDGCSNAPGGCSVYRTDEMMEKSARDLAALHPGFVKVVTKQSKTSWGGKERTDVVISWKQAAKAGVKS